MKIGHAECEQTKPCRVLTGDYKIRAEDGFEMFENYTRQSQQLLTIHSGGNRTRHTIGQILPYSSKTSKQNHPAPHVIIMPTTSAHISVT